MLPSGSVPVLSALANCYPANRLLPLSQMTRGYAAARPRAQRLTFSSYCGTMQEPVWFPKGKSPLARFYPPGQALHRLARLSSRPHSVALRQSADNKVDGHEDDARPLRKRVRLTWKPFFDKPAQAIVIHAKVSPAFQAVIDRPRDSELPAIGTAVMDMIGRARQHFGNGATLVRTNFGAGIVLFHAALCAPRLFIRVSVTTPPG
jgi:hypothetical protein